MMSKVVFAFVRRCQTSLFAKFQRGPQFTVLSAARMFVPHEAKQTPVQLGRHAEVRAIEAIPAGLPPLSGPRELLLRVRGRAPRAAPPGGAAPRASSGAGARARSRAPVPAFAVLLRPGRHGRAHAVLGNSR